MSSYDASLATLAAFIPRDAAQQELQSTYLAHLHTHANGLRRECHPAHLTASALVLSPDRAHILLHR
ncbi:MAG: NUDIX hydrolase, partial [Nocardioidaceae bacterium]